MHKILEREREIHDRCDRNEGAVADQLPRVGIYGELKPKEPVFLTGKAINGKIGPGLRK